MFELPSLLAWGDGAVAQDFRCGCRVGAAGPLQRSVLQRDCITLEILLLKLHYISFRVWFNNLCISNYSVNVTDVSWCSSCMDCISQCWWCIGWNAFSWKRSGSVISPLSFKTPESVLHPAASKALQLYYHKLHSNTH